MTTNSLSSKGSSTRFGLISASNLLLNRIMGFELKSTPFALRFSTDFSFAIYSKHTSLSTLLVTHTSDNSSFTTINLSTNSLPVSFASSNCALFSYLMFHICFLSPLPSVFLPRILIQKGNLPKFSLFSSNERLLIT